MKLRYRRILYISFILAFFVITSITIIYAAGYSYNFKKGRIEKTGILYLESFPKNADISINGKYEDKTPKRFTRLLPDSYFVQITKDGYYPWQQNLEVKSNLTTFSRDIVLFKKTLPINLIEGKINTFQVSPNQEKIIYSKIEGNNEELKMYNTKNKSDFSIKSFNTQTYNRLEFIRWSPSQNKALFKQSIGDFNKYLIIDTNTLKIKDIFDITRLNFDDVIWDENNDDYLYGLRKSVLYQIDLFDNSTTSLLSANIQDFLVKNQAIYYITTIGRESYLNKNTLEDRTVSEAKQIKLPLLSNFKFKQSAPGFLTLLDHRTNDLFVINDQSFSTEDITRDILLQDKAKEVVWSQALGKIMYYNDFEIWVFDTQIRQKNLITRFSETINEVAWYPRHNYLFYQTKNTIRVIEAKNYDTKNDVELVSITAIDSMAIDGAGKNIYFKGSIGNQSGIYKLEIQ